MYSSQRIFTAMKLLYDTIMVYEAHYTFSKLIECATPRVNPNGNYGLWVITMCECRFIDHNKCTILEGDADN